MCIPQEWLDAVPALQQGKHGPLLQRMETMRAQGTCIYPEKENVFYALQVLRPEDVKVIILGQDPYHGAGQAHGLAFSVPEHTAAKAIPPSLKNIFKEIYHDLYTHTQPLHTPPYVPNLKRWATQGILLLNTVLSVEHGKAHSHASWGWQDITSAILYSIASKQSVAVLLWGKAAQNYIPLFSQETTINNSAEPPLPKKHLILTAPHPSPLSAHTGFFGCKHFSQVNSWLKAQGHNEIIW